MSELLIWATKDEQMKFDEKLQQLCQTLLQTGLSYESEWQCKINIFDKAPAEKLDAMESKEEIKQVFTFNDALDSKVVHSVSLLNNKHFQCGTFQKGMVEFLYNSSIYETKNQKIFISGHSFTQGDLRVRVGALTVNYPKFLLV